MVRRPINTLVAFSTKETLDRFRAQGWLKRSVVENAILHLSDQDFAWARTVPSRNSTVRLTVDLSEAAHERMDVLRSAMRLGCGEVIDCAVRDHPCPRHDKRPRHGPGDLLDGGAELLQG